MRIARYCVSPRIPAFDLFGAKLSVVVYNTFPGPAAWNNNNKKKKTKKCRKIKITTSVQLFCKSYRVWEGKKENEEMVSMSYLNYFTFTVMP